MSTSQPQNAGHTNDSRVSRDRFYVGRLIDHGVSTHEHQKNAPPAYFVKLLDQFGHQHTIFGGGGLQAAFRNAKTQPQLNELIGVRENFIEPDSAVYRTRQHGVVVAERRQDAPKPKWVVERLDFFNERKAAARALRDASLPRHDAVKAHRDLEGAYLILDEGQKYAREEIKTEEGQRRFLALLRETLARTVERAVPLPVSEERLNAAAQRRTAVQHSQESGLARE